MPKICKIYNATRHNHYSYRYEWENINCEFVPNYSSHSLPVDLNASANDVKLIAGQIVRNAVDCGADTVMVSGLSSLVLFITLYAIHQGLNVIEPVFSGRDANVLIFSHYRDLTETLLEDLHYIRNL